MKQLFNVVFEMDMASRIHRKYVFIGYEDYQVEDMVIVDTCNGFKIGKIVGCAVSIPRNFTGLDLKEVVCKVDFSAYYNRKEKAQKRKEIEDEMKKRAKELQGIALYEMFAEKDKSMKGLLEQFKELSDE